MKKLLNTLYITDENAYLSLDGETVLITKGDGNKVNIPLINIENIVTFSYKGMSPALMGKCVEYNKNISMYTPNGKHICNVCSTTNGNVFLRTAQYKIAESDTGLQYVKNMIIGKAHNQKYLLLQYKNSHPMSVDQNKILKISNNISRYINDIKVANNINSIRGIEGNISAEYFSCFDDLILRDKNNFFFDGRNRRPPTDNVNALLSFVYSILSNECAAALQSVGLDPYVGFMHTLRPGRKSLALDLVEELRACYADRFVLTLINKQIISANDFTKQETGAVLINDDARKKLLSKWQDKKKEEITHPFLKEKVPWGLVPYVQSMLLARTIRGDLEQYPMFLWK